MPDLSNEGLPKMPDSYIEPPPNRNPDNPAKGATIALMVTLLQEVLETVHSYV